MVDEGESDFIKLPGFAANFYDFLTMGNAIKLQSHEIAEFLTSKTDNGKLLDVGTGPGRLLVNISKINPQIELYGFDISEAMLKTARKNLHGMDVELKQGNIEKTQYNNEFFDIITCTGSFYLWNHPVQCLNEIHRILKQGKSAYLFETYKDHDDKEFRQALKINLKKENILRKVIAPRFLMKQLEMTYKMQDIVKIIEKSNFAHSYDLEKKTIGGLPIWVVIKLTKAIK